MFPLKDKTNASVRQAWATHVVPRHGAPVVLITDNGQEFKATAWRTYLKQLGVEHRTTTPVHPQSNGRTERFNRTLKELLAKSVNNYTPDWEDRLGDCLAAYRVGVSDVTGHTPFFLLYRRRVRTPLTRLLQPHTPPIISVTAWMTYHQLFRRHAMPQQTVVSTIGND